MKDLFFPYYVNKGRLLDIYAILNQGYSEYEEITSSVASEKQKVDKGEMSIGASFKLFNFGGTASDEKTKTNTENNQSTEKKIQTITSTLRIVLDEMREKKYLCSLENVQDGDFVELDSITFQINSIKMLMDEIEEILKLYGDLKAFNSREIKTAVGQFKNVSKTIRTMFNGEEVLFEAENYAVVGNIFDEFIYQSIKSDLINSKYRCLCQIKKIYPEGTSLMRNTIFSKIKDKSYKDNVIKAVQQVCCENGYEFNSTAVAAIENKKVYEIEIIALYK